MWEISTIPSHKDLTNANFKAKTLKSKSTAASKPVWPCPGPTSILALKKWAEAGTKIFYPKSAR